MKVEIEDLSPIKKKLKFELPQEAYQKALEKAFKKIQKDVKLKGFRKGKVPRSILEKYYGDKANAESIQQLINDSYRQAVQEHQIQAVGMPEIDDLKMNENEPIQFNAEVEIQPKVEAKHYEKIKLEKQATQANDEEIDRELKNIQQAQAHWIPLDEGSVAAEGHQVTLSYEGKVDDQVFEGGKADNAIVQLGSGKYLPDFEKGIVGVKKGEEKSFEVVFPQDYPAEDLKGKKAVFSIKVHEIKKQDLPALDDEFAKDLGKYESLEELKKDIAEQIQKGKEQHERGRLFQEVIKHLIEKNPFEIPEVMISREMDYMWGNVQRQLSQQGMTPEKIGLNEQDYREKNKEQAVERIKGFLLFESIALQNDLKVEEEDINKKFEEISQQVRQPAEVIKKYYFENKLINQVISQVLEEKTLNLILSKAQLKEA